MTTEQATPEELWLDILEKDDRTSPEEYPDMALITFEEFRDNLKFFADQSLAAANERIARLEGVATAALRRARAVLSVAIRAAVEDIDFDPQEHHAIKDIDAALATLSPAGTVTPPGSEKK